MRDLIKFMIRCLANLFVSPFLLLHVLKVPFLGANRALEGSTELMGLFPGVTGQYLRRAFLAWTIAECHPTAQIGFLTTFSKTGARIEANVYIGSRCSIGLAHIQRDTLIASGVFVTSGTRMHGIDDPTKPIRDQEGINTLVTIGEGGWIGSLAVIMADVGAHTVIGAGAVVTKPIPEKVIAGGVPAKVLKER
jgi:virginiamycin A acetyltransferase